MKFDRAPAGLRQVAAWLEAAVSMIYPDACEICGRNQAGAREGYVCAECWRKPGNIRFVRPPFCDRCGLPYAGDVSGDFTCGNCADLKLHFDSARAAVVATPFILDVIHRYKYGRALWLEPFLADLLTRAAGEALANSGFDGIVPTPLHPLRERDREFNQAERLAAALSKRTGIPVLKGLARRTAATRTQALLDRRERSKNVAGAFEARRGISLEGQSLVVVDDVLTTGATTSALSLALRNAGAKSVIVWTVARGI